MTYDRDLLGDEAARPEVRAALNALESLGDGWYRVVASFARPRMADGAARQYGPVKRASWWGWLRRKPIQDWADRGLPGDDHVEYRERDGARVRISQPYQLYWDDLRDLVRHCDANGLKAAIHGGTWWFPGATIVVVVERDDRP